MSERRIDLRRLLWAVVIAAAVWASLLLAAAAWWAGSSVEQLAAGLRAEHLGFALAMFAVNHGVRFARWQWMLRIEGHRIAWGRSLRVFMAGLGLLPTPGKAGVAVRSLLLQRDGVPVDVSLALYFSERLFDLIGLLALAALLVDASAATRWMLALAVAVMGVAAVRIGPRVCAGLAARMTEGSRARRATEWLCHFLEHSADLMRGRFLAPFLLVGVAANLATAAVLWRVLHDAAQPIAAAQSAAIVAVSHLSGSLSLLPGGLGGFEAAMLASLAATGTAAGTALAALFLVRLVTVWFGVAVGLPLLWREMAAVRMHDGPAT